MVEHVLRERCEASDPPKLPSQHQKPHCARYQGYGVQAAKGIHATASFTLNVYAHTSEQMMKDTAARMQSYYDGLAAKGQNFLAGVNVGVK